MNRISRLWPAGYSPTDGALERKTLLGRADGRNIPISRLRSKRLTKPDLVFVRRMKKFLIGCGALSLILLVIGVIAFAIFAYRGTQLDKESSVYADAALKAIATDWSEKALLDRASPEFKHAVPIDQLDAYFRGCSKLGHLQQAEPMKGQAGISYHPKVGKRVQGSY